jgi:hypothetical protein
MEAKLIAILLGVIALIVGVVYEYHAIYNDGMSAGKAEVMTAWDKDKAEIATLAAEQAAKNASDEAAALIHDQEVHDDYEAQLSTANARADELTQRLRLAFTAARAAADSGPVQKGPNGSSSVPQSQPISVERLTQLFTAAAAECLANDDALDALYSDLSPQL